LPSPHPDCIELEAAAIEALMVEEAIAVDIAPHPFEPQSIMVEEAAMVDAAPQPLDPQPSIIELEEEAMED
jgi:hypothetical protein